jgi:Flp pilus assembly protein TadG
MKTFLLRTTAQIGQAMVEMAMMAPVLLLILITIIDFGRVMYFYMGVTGAARAGAQYGAQSISTAADTTGMVKAAKANAPASADGFTMNTPTASEICKCADGTALTCGPPLTLVGGAAIPSTCTDIRIYVKVQTSGTFKTLLNYYLIPNTANLTGLSEMRAQ